MDREAWQATVHRVAKSQIWLKWLSIAYNIFVAKHFGVSSQITWILLTLSTVSIYPGSPIYLICHPIPAWGDFLEVIPEIVFKFCLNQQFILFISLSCKQKVSWNWQYSCHIKLPYLAKHCLKSNMKYRTDSKTDNIMKMLYPLNRKTFKEFFKNSFIYICHNKFYCILELCSCCC